jgi:hypothetical protein
MESFPLLAILVLIFCIASFLLPFFVLRIRNEVISMNKKLDKFLNIQEQTTTSIPVKRREKICTNCSARNRLEDYTCTSCSNPLA